MEGNLGWVGVVVAVGGGLGDDDDDDDDVAGPRMPNDLNDALKPPPLELVLGMGGGVIGGVATAVEEESRFLKLVRRSKMTSVTFVGKVSECVEDIVAWTLKSDMVIYKTHFVSVFMKRAR